MNSKLFKNKNYMLLIIGNLVSLLGSNIQQFVLSLYVLAITGSATIFASMLAISILPRIILSPIAGVFGDWFDRKKSIIILDSINGILLLVFAYVTFKNSGLSIGLIYLLVIALEITEIFFHSSMSAVLPSVVKREEYLDANSLRSMVISIGQLMAPIIGAIIYGAFGLLIALIINAFSFLISAISESFIKIPKTNIEKSGRTIKDFKKDLFDGFNIIRNNPSIKTVIGVATVINFAIAPLFSVGLIYIIKEVLAASDFKFGLFQSILTASMILAPILLTQKLKRYKLGHVLIVSFFIIASLVFLMSFSTSNFMMGIDKENLIPYVYLTFLSFLMGLLISAVNIAINTLLQKIVPLEYMGRTSTVMGLLVTIAIPLGQMIFGSLYDIINPGYVVMINATIMFLGVLYYRKRLALIEDKEVQYDYER